MKSASSAGYVAPTTRPQSPRFDQIARNPVIECLKLPKHFGKLAVPSGTYRGVDYNAGSFQDSALWVANGDVPADVVYKMLTVIFADEGLKHMVGQKKTFKNMSLETGATNIVTPFHPGAEKFWKEKEWPGWMFPP